MGMVVRTLIKHGQYPDSVSWMSGGSHTFQAGEGTRCNIALNFRGTTPCIAVRKVIEIGILCGLEKCFKADFQS